MRRISRLKQSASGLVNAVGRSQAQNKFVRGENRCSLTVSNVKWIQIWAAAENIICCPFSAEYKVAVFFFLRSESIKLWSEYSVYSYFPGMSLNCIHVPNVTLTFCLSVDLVQLSLAQTFFFGRGSWLSEMNDLIRGWREPLSLKVIIKFRRKRSFCMVFIQLHTKPVGGNASLFL